MITGLLPNRGQSPASDDSFAQQQQQQQKRPRGRSPRSRRSSRPRPRPTVPQVSAAPRSPTNAHSVLWTLMLIGLVGTIVNIAYVSWQTALTWESASSQHPHATTTTMTITGRQQVGHVTKEQSSSIIDLQERFHNPNDPFYDKEHLIRLLQEAGITPIDNETAQALPTWSEITSLYGTEPVYYGLDSCARFQASGTASQHFLAVAGTFNTGTNLLAELLIANCYMPARMAQYGHKQRGIRWQTIWGKHTPVGNETFRQEHRVYTDVPDLVANDVFAGVILRDPYRWMQSMCRHKYAANWLHDPSHCPALVPNEADMTAKPHLRELDHIPVHVEYAEFTVKHESLVHFWNEWYQDYLNANFPYLLVRFEDLIFHPKQVVQTVCQCAGGELNHGDFKYITGSAKKGEGAHGKERTSYLDALSRYGRKAGRYDGMEAADLQYARDYLDPKLMELFRYPFHDEI